ncbi:MAG: UbiA family prenyltransferase [Elusimicrobiota bacterium]
MSKIFILSVGIIFAFQADCVINDFFNIKEDRVTNPSRPLISGRIPPGIYRLWGGGCFFISLLFSFLAGVVPLLFIVTFHLLYTVYSVPPLNLKRFFPINVFIVALNSLIAMVAGFSVLAGADIFYLFPRRLALLILVVMVTSINMIYLKDRKGDMAAGIKTIPTIFSKDVSRKVVAFLTVIAYFSVPVILKINILYLFSFIGASIGAYLVLRERWNESPYFITYFIYYIITLYFLSINIEVLKHGN